eukprot:jgi/Tetstr1/458852/TSEL_004361.t1
MKTVCLRRQGSQTRLLLAPFLTPSLHDPLHTGAAPTHIARRHGRRLAQNAHPHLEAGQAGESTKGLEEKEEEEEEEVMGRLDSLTDSGSWEPVGTA